LLASLMLVPLGTMASAGSTFTLLSTEKRVYTLTAGPDSAILSSEGATIRLYRSCTAKSQQLGTGRWDWANGGFTVDFASHRVTFPRQDSPYFLLYRDTRCRLQ